MRDKRSRVGQAPPHRPGDGGDGDGGGVDDDVAALAEAVRGARPLASGPRRIAPAIAGARGVRVSRPAAAAPAAVGPALTIDEQGESWSGRADGVDRRVVRKLRAGALPVEATLDLHRKPRAAAAAALDQFVGAARAAGRRCLLVIHGRGLHSETGTAPAAGPPLRQVVKEALLAGPHAAAVLAFSSAPPSQGGAGATLILLRR